MKTLQLIFCLSIAFITLHSHAQDGSPDLTFGNDGIVIQEIFGEDDYVTDTTKDTNGRIICVGYTWDPVQDVTFNFVAVFLEDGSFDTSFGQNGYILNDINSNYYNEVHVQSDNHILVGGGNEADYKISRFSPEGNLDTTFGDNGALSQPVNAGINRFELDVNNNLFFLGQINIAGDYHVVLKKYLPNGTVDTSFGDNGEAYYPIPNAINANVHSLKLNESQKIIVDCSYQINGILTRNVLRFLSDGSIDTSFGLNGAGTYTIEDDFSCESILLEDGSVLINCRYYDITTFTEVKKMLKLRTDGTYDQNFGGNGFINNMNGVIVQENQRFIADGSYIDWEGGIHLNYSRYSPNGSLDGSFQFSANYSVLETANPIILNSGKLVVAGSSIWYDGPSKIILQRFNNNPLGVPENSIDEFSVYPNPSDGFFTFNNNNGFSSELPYLVTDVSGKIIQKGIINSENTEIDLSEAQSGIYFLNSSNSTLKLLKN